MDILSYILGALFLFFVIIFLSKKKGIKGYAKARIEKQWEHVESIEQPAQRVLEADSVLHEVFKELGYKGSLGNCLKRCGKKLPNEDDVWKAHKLRNRIAHTVGMQVSDKDAARAVQAFRRAVFSFL